MVHITRSASIDAAGRRSDLRPPILSPSAYAAISRGRSPLSCVTFRHLAVFVLLLGIELALCGVLMSQMPDLNHRDYLVTKADLVKKAQAFGQAVPHLQSQKALKGVLVGFSFGSCSACNKTLNRILPKLRGIDTILVVSRSVPKFEARAWNTAKAVFPKYKVYVDTTFVETTPLRKDASEQEKNEARDLIAMPALVVFSGDSWIYLPNSMLFAEEYTDKSVTNEIKRAMRQLARRQR